MEVSMLSLVLSRLDMSRHCVITHTHHPWQHLHGSDTGPQGAMIGPVSVPKATMEECSQLPSCSLFWPPQKELRVTLPLLLALALVQGESENDDDLSDKSASLCSICGWKDVFWGHFLGNLSSLPEAGGISG